MKVFHNGETDAVYERESPYTVADIDELKIQ